MQGQGQLMDKDKDKILTRVAIDENLRRVYQETLQEEVPDRFRALLEQLRKRQESKGRRKSVTEIRANS